MINQKKFIVSHAPFWHDGSGVTERNYHIILAALPALIFGIYIYGIPALGVAALAVSSAMLWELAYTRISKMPETIGDGSSALIGVMVAMLLPPVMPWWVVIVGTLLAVVIGRQIFGGIGGNPFNPAVIALAILGISWPQYLDFNAAVVNYNLDFNMLYPLAAAKHAGLHKDLFDLRELTASFSAKDLLMGKQVGALGSTFGLGIIAGGIYLIFRGFIRWEISISFLAGVFITAMLFNAADPTKYAGPVFHLLTGYTLLGAFFLATEDSSSPVNCLPMLIYGVVGGIMTVLIRNIGAYADGVIYAILIINLINPLLDKIRPKALGKVV
ncbi:Ion-translocating oxidoreductase complex, subunit D [Desulfonema limicola]|uniref:Ion-translocating oxidoreductase complex subunit D n=1 Tax=Desulfonema limicola TaxID=45656 RepID=A0A975B774_9BACT|nr:RnfABCDGE type electron transport complex subunit D [Desulfonema limicola]QTA80071.1 Ion-translocating oxidoreductase complex, subunit D [Desulfonema limicola]